MLVAIIQIIIHLILALLPVVIFVGPFVWFWHAMSYNNARDKVKRLGHKGDYGWTVKHRWNGWEVVPKDPAKEKK